MNSYDTATNVEQICPSCSFHLNKTTVKMKFVSTSIITKHDVHPLIHCGCNSNNGWFQKVVSPKIYISELKFLVDVVDGRGYESFNVIFGPFPVCEGNIAAVR